MRLSILQDRLDRNDIKSLLSFPNESLILSVREHPILLLFRILKVLFACGLAALLFPILAYFPSQSLILSLEIFLLILAAGMAYTIKDIVHWYFHLYLITNRKIAEISYSPLSSESSNYILLDQLRCTEIDAELKGFVSEIFDIGNVTITFDRPTHQETFTLVNIRSPRKTANLLSSKLHAQSILQRSIWSKSEGRHNYTYLEENNDRVLPN